MAVLVEFGTQSMDVISSSCYLFVRDWDPWQNRCMARTSDRTLTAFQPFPTLENICTPFEFKKPTAISDSTRWGGRIGLLTATIAIEIHGTYAD